MIIVLVFPHQELVEHAPSDPLSTSGNMAELIE
jgi:hypothetical protein